MFVVNNKQTNFISILQNNQKDMEENRKRRNKSYLFMLISLLSPLFLFLTFFYSFLQKYTFTKNYYFINFYKVSQKQIIFINYSKF